MKEYADICHFVGEDEPIRGSIESIKDILSFFNDKCRIDFEGKSNVSYKVVSAYTSIAFSVMYKLQSYLEQSGEILPF